MKKYIVLLFICAMTIPALTHAQGFVVDSPEYMQAVTLLKELKVKLHELQLVYLTENGKVAIEEIISDKPAVNEFISIKARNLKEGTPVDVFFDDFIAVTKIYPSSNGYLAFNVPSEIQTWVPCLAWNNPGGMQCKIGQRSEKVMSGKGYEVSVRNSSGFSNKENIRIAN